MPAFFPFVLINAFKALYCRIFLLSGSLQLLMVFLILRDTLLGLLQKKKQNLYFWNGCKRNVIRILIRIRKWLLFPFTLKSIKMINIISKYIGSPVIRWVTTINLHSRFTSPLWLLNFVTVKSHLFGSPVLSIITQVSLNECFFM